MSTNSAIEWTEATWNPIAGCTPVSPGCLNCYAATMAHRLDAMGQAKYRGLTVLHNGRRTFNGKIATDVAALAAPLSWRKPRRVFVNSMSDLFHEEVADETIDNVFAIMALCHRHTFQVLTKRPQRMAAYFDRLRQITNGAAYHHICDAMRRIVDPETITRHVEDRPGVTRWPLDNVWLGTSVEDQQRADARIPHLLKCPAAVRFLSVEPLLGAVSIGEIKSEGVCYAPLEGYLDDDPRIHWVIVGGESGPGARPCNVEWIRNIVGQCKAAGVPVFVKQLGADPVEPVLGMEATRQVNQPFMGSGWAHLKLDDPKGGDPSEWPEDLRVREFPAKAHAHAAGAEAVTAHRGRVNERDGRR
jgi:protein gp37